jgi:formamidopyrimidine-DNA glycosylase
VPELPDVEGYRSSLARTLPGRRVCQVDVRDAGVLRNTTPRTLDRQLAGHRFTDPRRHGKWLILPTDGPTLLVHSGMTGRPYYAEDDQPEQGWERLVIDLDRVDGSIRDRRPGQSPHRRDLLAGSTHRVL